MKFLEVGGKDFRRGVHVLREEVEHIVDVYEDLIVLAHFLLWTAVD